MAISLPFVSSYDPPGSSEGTLDPLGLYLIADQLAVQLVPGVRERMQRIRFLTAMAVGALVTTDLEDDPRNRDASPYLVWEWLVVEAMVRSKGDDDTVWGVPGTLVTKRAISQPGWLDARNYLKSPRIFGFHGVYKRLAIQLGVLDVNLGLGPQAEGLANAWARDQDWAGLASAEAKERLAKWHKAVSDSLSLQPPRTKSGWKIEIWQELAEAFAPDGGGPQERQYLRDLLLATDDRRLGALPEIWPLQGELSNEAFTEETLYARLGQQAPQYYRLLQAILAYETFARKLQNAFDILKAEAAKADARGFEVPAIAVDSGFIVSAAGLHHAFSEAHTALGLVPNNAATLQNQFGERFAIFGEPLAAADCARSLCAHHEAMQKAKSTEGKRPWFDRVGGERIYIRQAYRQPRPEIKSGRYVHAYRGAPIRRFYRDLQEP